MAFSERDERDFREAAGLHQAGNLPAAIQAYRKLLKRSPKQPILLNLLGLAEFQAGQFEAAAHDLQQAAAIDPRIPDIHYNLATVLQRLGRFEQALPYFEKAIAAKPNDADARNNFGSTLKSVGRNDDAIREFRKAVEISPNHAGAYLNLGNALSAQGQAGEAIAHIERSIALQPRNPEAYASFATTLVSLNRKEEAAAALGKAIALNPVPDSADACFSRGVLLASLERFDEAAGYFLRVTKLKPDFSEAYVELGNALQKMRKFEEAIPYYKTALELRPDYFEAHYNYAEALQALDRHPESIEPLEKALALKPDFAMAIGNLANAHFHGRRYELAEQLFRRALAEDESIASIQIGFATMLAVIDKEDEALWHLDQALAKNPDDDVVKSWNMGFFCLSLGRWDPGWELQEYRFKSDKIPVFHRDYQVPRWDGKKLEGTLLVWAEQGLGDQILWSSIFRELIPLAHRVIVECEPRLVPLFSNSFTGIDFVPMDPDVLYAGGIDAHIPMASLGKLFRHGWEKFPHHESGYLRADENHIRILRNAITQKHSAAVGISWRSVNPVFGEAKTARLVDFKSMFGIADCKFVDLQYGDTREERDEARAALSVDVAPVEGIDNMNDIFGLAALITACDAVVTTSNTTAHLSGALGKHTWVMVPFGRGRLWYWFKERLDSPWYPNVHLVRQRRDESWEAVAERAAQELSAFLSERGR